MCAGARACKLISEIWERERAHGALHISPDIFESIFNAALISALCASRKEWRLINELAWFGRLQARLLLVLLFGWDWSTTLKTLADWSAGASENEIHSRFDKKTRKPQARFIAIADKIVGQSNNMRSKWQNEFQINTNGALCRSCVTFYQSKWHTTTATVTSAVAAVTK